MGQFAEYNSLVSEYEDVADFATVYIREAHAVDEWPLDVVDFPVKQHTSMEERFHAARNLLEHGARGEFLVDDFDDNTRFSYSAAPERLYIILNGVVVYRGGKGPFDYRVSEVEKWMKDYRSRKTE